MDEKWRQLEAAIAAVAELDRVTGGDWPAHIGERGGDKIQRQMQEIVAAMRTTVDRIRGIRKRLRNGD